MNTKHPALIGIVPAIVALVAWIASFVGVEVDQEGIATLIGQLIGAASGLLSVGLMIWTAYKNRPVNVDPTKVPSQLEKTAGTAPVK